MAEKVIVSPRFTLQVRDFLKSFGLSMATALLVYIQDVVDSGSFDFSWKQIGKVLIAAAVSYLGKNFFAAPKVVTTYKTNEQAKEVAETINETK